MIIKYSCRKIEQENHKVIKKYENFLYCKEDGYVYPIINGIPCLVKNNAILASQIHQFFN